MATLILQGGYHNICGSFVNLTLIESNTNLPKTAVKLAPTDPELSCTCRCQSSQTLSHHFESSILRSLRWLRITELYSVVHLHHLLFRYASPGLWKQLPLSLSWLLALPMFIGKLPHSTSDSSLSMSIRYYSHFLYNASPMRLKGKKYKWRDVPPRQCREQLMTYMQLVHKTTTSEIHSSTVLIYLFTSRTPGRGVADRFVYLVYVKMLY